MASPTSISHPSRTSASDGKRAPDKPEIALWLSAAPAALAASLDRTLEGTGPAQCSVKLDGIISRYAHEDARPHAEHGYAATREAANPSP
jgi:hypothetical protein